VGPAKSELERMFKKLVLPKFTLISQHFIGGAEENDKSRTRKLDLIPGLRKYKAGVLRMTREFDSRYRN